MQNNGKYSKLYSSENGFDEAYSLPPKKRPLFTVLCFIALIFTNLASLAFWARAERKAEASSCIRPQLTYCESTECSIGPEKREQETLTPCISSSQGRDPIRKEEADAQYRVQCLRGRATALARRCLGPPDRAYDPFSLSP